MKTEDMFSKCGVMNLWSEGTTWCLLSSVETNEHLRVHTCIVCSVETNVEFIKTVLFHAQLWRFSFSKGSKHLSGVQKSLPEAVSLLGLMGGAGQEGAVALIRWLIRITRHRSCYDDDVDGLELTIGIDRRREKKEGHPRFSHRKTWS